MIGKLDKLLTGCIYFLRDVRMKFLLFCFGKTAVMRTKSFRQTAEFMCRAFSYVVKLQLPTYTCILYMLFDVVCSCICLLVLLLSTGAYYTRTPVIVLRRLLNFNRDGDTGIRFACVSRFQS
jgi:hypothetical protein